MKITETKIKVSDLVENYKDNGDGGVFGYNNRLTIRPSFQREFIYGEKQRAAVIDSVMNGFPLNVMYWSKTGANTYEVLDGQQRTVSIRSDKNFLKKERDRLFNFFRGFDQFTSTKIHKGGESP